MHKNRTKEPKGGEPIKVREAVVDYIVAQSDASTRSKPGMIEHMQKLHAALKAEFGHDDIETIVAEIRRLKEKEKP